MSVRTMILSLLAASLSWTAQANSGRHSPFIGIWVHDEVVSLYQGFVQAQQSDRLDEFCQYNLRQSLQRVYLGGLLVQASGDVYRYAANDRVDASDFRCKFMERVDLGGQFSPRSNQTSANCAQVKTFAPYTVFIRQGQYLFVRGGSSRELRFIPTDDAQLLNYRQMLATCQNPQDENSAVGAPPEYQPQIPQPNYPPQPGPNGYPGPGMGGPNMGGPDAWFDFGPEYGGGVPGPQFPQNPNYGPGPGPGPGPGFGYGGPNFGGYGQPQRPGAGFQPPMPPMPPMPPGPGQNFGGPPPGYNQMPQQPWQQQMPPNYGPYQGQEPGGYNGGQYQPQMPPPTGPYPGMDWNQGQQPPPQGGGWQGYEPQGPY